MGVCVCLTECPARLVLVDADVVSKEQHSEKKSVKQACRVKTAQCPEAHLPDRTITGSEEC